MEESIVGYDIMLIVYIHIFSSFGLGNYTVYIYVFTLYIIIVQSELYQTLKNSQSKFNKIRHTSGTNTKMHNLVDQKFSLDLRKID